MSTQIERGETETTSADLGVAPLWRRATGRLGDLGLWVVLVLVLSMVTGSDAPDGERSYPVWLYPSLAVLPIIYEAVAVRWRKGQTWGKSWADTRVVTLSGGTPGLTRSVVRAAMTWPFLAIAISDQLGPWIQIPAIALYIMVFAVALTNRRHRGLHDLAAATIVIPGPLT
jgi:uncharacterized RDD family membrane protein YckC